MALSRGLSGNRDPRLGTVTKIAAACRVSLRFAQSGSPPNSAAAVPEARGPHGRQVAETVYPEAGPDLPPEDVPVADAWTPLPSLWSNSAPNQ